MTAVLTETDKGSLILVAKMATLAALQAQQATPGFWQAYWMRETARLSQVVLDCVEHLAVNYDK